jgi:hypothetical protein
VYCGFAGALTDEHVLPTWIATLLHRGGRFETITTNDAGKLVRNFETVEALGVVAHVVCERCNTGWMERLEAQVRRHLVPMIRGEATHLDALAIRTLARWTAKTHQMYRFQLKRPPAAPALAAVHTGHVPRATFLLAAAWNGRESAYIVHNSRTQRITKIITPGTPSDDLVFYSELLTLRIGYVALQTFEITPYRVGPQWRVPMEGSELRYVRALWPRPKGSINWPPAQALDDRTFGAFDYRTRWAGVPT